ncbi:MAG: hypothetical protein A2W25_07175 [candidate division Zixibacteria bacterium RBG_16_53_22]|nr:MAG: hypothetical protein A2W25_07175 [candidate division Zixibacteria bacterium RBG_16_53_22]
MFDSQDVHFNALDIARRKDIIILHRVGQSNPHPAIQSALDAFSNNHIPGRGFRTANSAPSKMRDHSLSLTSNCAPNYRRTSAGAAQNDIFIHGHSSRGSMNTNGKQGMPK